MQTQESLKNIYQFGGGGGAPSIPFTYACIVNTWSGYMVRLPFSDWSCGVRAGRSGSIVMTAAAGAEEQQEQRSRGAEEQRSKGAEERGSWDCGGTSPRRRWSAERTVQPANKTQCPSCGTNSRAEVSEGWVVGIQTNEKHRNDAKTCANTRRRR